MSRYRKFSEIGNNPADNVPQQDRINIYDSAKPTNPNTVIILENENQKNMLIKQNDVVCIDIMATWCQPCKDIAPHYANLAELYTRPGKCVFAKENVEFGLCRNVAAVPCFNIYKQGKKVYDDTGANMRKIEETIKQLL